jgi:hypothetical protein
MVAASALLERDDVGSREAAGVTKVKNPDGAIRSHRPQYAAALASFAGQCVQPDGKRWRLRSQVTHTKFASFNRFGGKAEGLSWRVAATGETIRTRLWAGV